MSKVDAVFRREFEIKLHETFPDVATKGIVSRPQLIEVMEKLKTEKFPLWLMKDKVGRGLYALEGGRAKHDVVGNTALKEETMQSFEVDYTNVESLIPKKDPNFVPFGSKADLQNIIKSQIFYPSYISGPAGNGKTTMVVQI